MKSVAFVRKFKHEENDWKWTTFFCDFYSLLDNDTREKYEDGLLGLKPLNCGCEGKPHIWVGDTSYSLLSESSVYRAIAAICEAEGDYQLALAFLMCVKACIPQLSPTPKNTEVTRLRGQNQLIDGMIEDMTKKLPNQRRNLLKEWKKYVR